MGTAAAGAAALGAVAGATKLIPQAATAPSTTGVKAREEASTTRKAQFVGAPLQAQPTSTESWLPASWDYTADVVVVGYGGAGACAAINASDAGAKVIVLEKTPFIPNRVNTYNGVTYPITGGGGNTCICGAGFWIPAGSNPPGPSDITNAIVSIYAAEWGKTPLDVVAAFVQEAMNNVTWADAVGINHGAGAVSAQEIPGVPPMQLTEYHPPAGVGSSLFTTWTRQSRRGESRSYSARRHPA